MRTRLTTLAILAFASAVVSLPAAPAAAQTPLYGIVRFGGEYGGDKLLEFEYEDGTTPDVTAGGGLLLSVGGGSRLVRLGRGSLDAQVTAGFKWRTIPPAENQDANWIRFPVEGLLMYRLPSGFRFGAGPTVHLANKFKTSGAVLNESIEFDNTPGFVVQAEYVRRNISFDLRYTSLEYEIKRSVEKVDASSIGVGISFFIGKSATTKDSAAP